MLMQGMVAGITNGLSAVKAAITGAGDNTISWFKEKLGIHSPSRVFASLGGYTMAGLEQGLLQGQKGPLDAVTGMGKQLTAAGAMGIGAGRPLTMDNRPPLSAAGAAGTAVGQSQQPIIIQVHAAPGMDEQQLARLVATHVEQIQRKSQVRGRSALSDQE